MNAITRKRKKIPLEDIPFHWLNLKIKVRKTPVSEFEIAVERAKKNELFWKAIFKTYNGKHYVEE